MLGLISRYVIPRPSVPGRAQVSSDRWLLSPNPHLLHLNKSLQCSASRLPLSPVTFLARAGSSMGSKSLRLCICRWHFTLILSPCLTQCPLRMITKVNYPAFFWICSTCIILGPSSSPFFFFCLGACIVSQAALLHWDIGFRLSAGALCLSPPPSPGPHHMWHLSQSKHQG